MSSRTLDSEALRQFVRDAVVDPAFRHATFGGPRRAASPCPWRRVTVRPVDIRGQTRLQVSYFSAKKCITRNLEEAEIAPAIDEILGLGFAALHMVSAQEETDVRVTKKGKILIGRRPTAATALVLSHNRAKDLPLPEGRADHLLQTMGIMTQGGVVRPTMRPKYTQINEFLKQLHHVLDDAGLRSLGRTIEILDCGCGSSYLTLAAHHYLNEILGLPAQLLGVDVNDELIRKSAARAERLNASRVAFTCSAIDAARARPDVVIALHACDTATDDAIALAVAAEARLLLSVPCCHHHLNDQLRPEGAAAVLRPMLRHGILWQRTADLVTDSFRALALRIMGYRTDVVEFISTEHTARNLMIRALRGPAPGDSRHVREYLDMRRFWGVTPYLEERLGERFHDLLADATHAAPDPAGKRPGGS